MDKMVSSKGFLLKTVFGNKHYQYTEVRPHSDDPQNHSASLLCNIRSKKADIRLVDELQLCFI
jgi:hypothetical protein